MDRKVMNNDIINVLIYGAIVESGSPICRAVFKGAQAYERHHLPYYIQEIIELRQNGNYKLKSFVRLTEMVNKLGLSAFYEIGSTLFSSIDKYKLVTTDTRQRLNYVGIEPSRLLRDVTHLLYPDEQITLYDDYKAVPEVSVPACARSYQATSYAFSSTSDLVNWLGQFEVTLDSIWFSVNDNDEFENILGNSITLFSFSQFAEQIRCRGYEIEIHGARKISHFSFDFYQIDLLCARNEAANELVDISEAGKIAEISQNLWGETLKTPIHATDPGSVSADNQEYNFSCVKEMLVNSSD